MNVFVIAIAGLLLALGVQTARLHGSQVEVAESAASVERLRGAAAQALASETEKVRVLEGRLHTFQLQQEKADANNATVVAGLERRLRDAGGPGGRLRDPNAVACGGGSRGAESQVAAAAGRGEDHGAEAGGLLSAELTGLLQRTQREADAINVAYASARAYAVELQAACGGG